MSTAFTVEHYESVIPLEERPQELVRPFVDTAVVPRMRVAIELDGADSEISRPADKRLNRELRILVGREDDQRLRDARDQPRTPAANKSVMLTPDFHWLNMGCSFPGMIVVPFSVFWKHSNWLGRGRLRTSGE